MKSPRLNVRYLVPVVRNIQHVFLPFPTSRHVTAYEYVFLLKSCILASGLERIAISPAEKNPILRILHILEDCDFAIMLLCYDILYDRIGVDK